MASRTTGPIPARGARLPAELSADDGCLGRTCLKWEQDGKLTDFDLQMVMRKLRRVDHQLSSQEDGHDSLFTLRNG